MPPVYAHQRGNWFPRLHAVACLGGTYTAFAMLAIIDPKSVAGTPLLVLIPACILLPFFASFIAFVVFAPVSFGLYWFMERFSRRSLSCHCVAGALCVALTLGAILLAGYFASLFGGRPEEMEDTGLFDQVAGRQEQLFFAAWTISGMAGGIAFYFARKMGISKVYAEMPNGGRS